MGGLLFNTERLEVSKFLPYKEEVENILIENEIEFSIPFYFRDKKDFGDLDILICSDDISNERLLGLFPAEKSFSNGNVLSINYKGFQIDFIKQNPKDFEIAKQYYSWNDMGNLIGRLATRVGAKFGWDGLKYKYFIGNKRNDILLSRDITEILNFLDLSPERFYQGFEKIEDIFEFIIASKYFNPYIYDMENLNKVNRDRNKKRTTYLAWLKYIDKYKIGEDNYIPFIEDKSIYLDEVDEYFPRAYLKKQIDVIDKREQKLRELADKFNGRKIMEKYPELKGKSLGDAILKFKENFSNFENYINENTSEKIMEDFDKHYKR